MRPWIKYLFVRLGVFAVTLAVLLVLQVNPFLAAVIAAIVSLVVSYIFFRRMRDAVAAELAARNAKPEPVRNADTEAEDAALDRLE